VHIDRKRLNKIPLYNTFKLSRISFDEKAKYQPWTIKKNPR
jgi:hypothetical protein